MNTASTGSGPSAGTSSAASNEATCRPKALRRTTMSMPPTSGCAPPVVARASTIIPAQVPSAGSPPSIVRAQRGQQAGALGDQPERGALAARQHDAVEPLEVGRGPDLGGRGAGSRERVLVLGEGPLHRQHPDARPAEARQGPRHHPRPWSSPASPIAEISRPGIASLRPADTRATTSGSRKWVTASTIARARRGGSALL